MNISIDVDDDMNFTESIQNCAHFDGPIETIENTTFWITNLECRGRYVIIAPDSDHDIFRPCEIIILGYIDNYSPAGKWIFTVFTQSL